MGLVDRVKNILVTPKTEWDAVAAEPANNAALITGYVLPLAALAAIAGFIGLSIVGMSAPFVGTVRMGIVWGIVNAVFQVVMAVVMVYVVAFIIDALAPTFGAQKGLGQALKVAAYAYTPVWIASVLTIIPMLGILVLLAGLYGIYLLYLGLPRVMRAPPEKAAGYTAVVVVAAIVVGVIIGFVGGLITSAGMPHFGPGMGRGANVSFDGDGAMGKLDDFSRKMEEANRKMEAAQKSGDPGKQAEAAMAALGTAMSGGQGVEPVQLDALKPLVPEKFAGLARTDLRTDRSGVKGFMVAKAEASYADPGNTRSVELEVTDTGGAAGLMGLAAWMGVQGEHEDSQRREVTRAEGDRLVHEEVDKQGGGSEYTVVVGRRFVVSAHGNGVPLDTLKSGVNTVDLKKLEAMK